MPCLLALDQGTTSSRAILFDETGRVLGSDQREFAQHFPQPGWVEHDANEIWCTQRDCVRTVLQNTATAAADVLALGITNQRETTVLWDRATGQPLAPAIVWQDRRTAMQCEALRAAGYAAEIRDRTGLELDPYFSGTKLAWLLDHVPEARVRAERGELAFGTVDCWLSWHLTGGACHQTDASNASRTLLFNLHTGNWDPWLLDLLDIPHAVLPRVVDSCGHLGDTTPDLFGAPIRIAGMAGDQQAATFGQACFRPGMAKNTYGTGCFLMMQNGVQVPASKHRLLSTVGWRQGGDTCFLREGSVFMGGALLQWLRDGLGFFTHAAESEALAASVLDTGGVVLVPALTGLGAPHWDPHARGTLLGATRGTTRAHITRAALEAIALQSDAVLRAMMADGASPLNELRVDGGASRNNLLMQLQADISGVPVVRPKTIETTALGAAYLAGLGVGLWTSTENIAAHWVEDRRFEPQQGSAWRDAKREEWNRAVERSLHWAGAV